MADEYPDLIRIDEDSNKTPRGDNSSLEAHNESSLYLRDLSGEGLLDLTRESDDTSLGAELLDEIYPGGTNSESGIGESGVYDSAISMDIGMGDIQEDKAPATTQETANITSQSTTEATGRIPVRIKKDRSNNASTKVRNRASGAKRTESHLESLGWWIPRKYRDDIIYDMIKDCRQFRAETGSGELRIWFQIILWQLFWVVVARFKAIIWSSVGWIAAHILS